MLTRSHGARARDRTSRPDASTEMNADRARVLAESLHHGQRDGVGAPLIEHIRRVALSVPRRVRVVAWLHESLEHTSISEEALLAEGLSIDGLRALRLLTRNLDSQSDTIYLAHIELIACAIGPGADTARTVKRADLTDRMLHPLTRRGGWSPPYQLGLEILDRAAGPLYMAGSGQGRAGERGHP